MVLRTCINKSVFELDTVVGYRQSLPYEDFTTTINLHYEFFPVILCDLLTPMRISPQLGPLQGHFIFTLFIYSTLFTLHYLAYCEGNTIIIVRSCNWN